MNTDIEVYDNFLENPIFQTISERIMGSYFHWSYTDWIIDEDKRICDELDNHQMYSLIYDDNEPRNNTFDLMKPILIHEKVNCKSIIKIKANLSFRTQEKIIHGHHVDLPYECKTAILYLNTNDGGTIFKDGREVGSIANRMVIFNSQLEHTGTTCTDKKTRVVLNFNYF